jgi:hypothetical protein
VLLFVLRVRLPACPLFSITGIPCPGCGSTRATLALAGGDFIGAFLLNPGWVIACVAGVAAWIYALGAVFLKMPRVRAGAGGFFSDKVFTVGLIAAIFANWVWVVENPGTNDEYELSTNLNIRHASTKLKASNNEIKHRLFESIGKHRFTLPKPPRTQ